MILLCRWCTVGISKLWGISEHMSITISFLLGPAESKVRWSSKHLKLNVTNNFKNCLCCLLHLNKIIYAHYQFNIKSNAAPVYTDHETVKGSQTKWLTDPDQSHIHKCLSPSECLTQTPFQIWHIQHQVLSEQYMV